MFALSETFGLSRNQKQSGISAIPLLILLIIYFFSLPANAETSIYVFVPGQSTVVQTGGIAGVNETYSIEGKFRLTVDFDAGIASFDKVDANLTEPTGFLYSQSLGEIFNLTALAGTIIDDTAIQFEGKTADGTESDVSLTLTFIDDLAHITGQTTPPPNSADMFLYELDAIATKKYAGGTGEPNNPYQIATAADLILLGDSPEDYYKHFILTADIDLDPNLPGRKVFDRAVIAPFPDDIKPVNSRFAGGGGQQCTQHVNGCCLAGTVRAQEAEYLSLGNIERDIVYRNQFSKLFDQPFNLYHVHTAVFPPQSGNLIFI